MMETGNKCGVFMVMRASGFYQFMQLKFSRPPFEFDWALFFSGMSGFCSIFGVSDCE